MSNETTEMQDVVGANSQPEAAISPYHQAAALMNGESATPKTVAVMLDGQTKKLTVDELSKGYMLHADYTRKTQELAEQRRQAEQQQKDITSLHEKEAKRLEQLEKFLSEMEADVPSLLGLHGEERERWQQHRSWMEQLRQQQSLTETRQRLKQEEQSLASHMPDLAAPEARQQLAAYLKDVGFGVEELSQVMDHRSLMIAEKARRYDALMQHKDDRLSPDSKPSKPQTPGSRHSKDDAGSEQRKEILRKLRQSGSLRDAARLVEMGMR